MARKVRYPEAMFMALAKGTRDRIDAAAAIRNISRQDFVRMAIGGALDAIENERTTWRALITAAMRQNGETFDDVQAIHSDRRVWRIDADDVTKQAKEMLIPAFGDAWLDEPFDGTLPPAWTAQVWTARYLYSDHYEKNAVKVRSILRFPLNEWRPQAEPITDETRIGELPKTL